MRNGCCGNSTSVYWLAHLDSKSKCTWIHSISRTDNINTLFLKTETFLLDDASDDEYDSLFNIKWCTIVCCKEIDGILIYFFGVI
jgi:hypothetical protein